MPHKSSRSLWEPRGGTEPGGTRAGESPAGHTDVSDSKPPEGRGLTCTCSPQARAGPSAIALGQAIPQTPLSMLGSPSPRALRSGLRCPMALAHLRVSVSPIQEAEPLKLVALPASEGPSEARAPCLPGGWCHLESQGQNGQAPRGHGGAPVSGTLNLALGREAQGLDPDRRSCQTDGGSAALALG